MPPSGRSCARSMSAESSSGASSFAERPCSSYPQVVPDPGPTYEKPAGSLRQSRTAPRSTIRGTVIFPVVMR